MKALLVCLLAAALAAANPLPASPDSTASREIEPLPIISYDTDAGFGYGAKVFLLNQLGARESFDLVLFRSSKGERWYRLVVSFPDFELRQGTAYPLAVDLLIDYDKWIAIRYFGTAEAPAGRSQLTFTKEPLQLGLTIGRGFTPWFVGQLILRYRTARNSHIPAAMPVPTTPAVNYGTARWASAALLARYDRRDSYINPSTGVVAQAEAEVAPGFSFTNTAFTRSAFLLQFFRPLWQTGTVLALQLSAQQISGTALPLQALGSVGGTNNLRGYPVDRFLGNVTVYSNLEVRYPIYRRIGGIIGADWGGAWKSVGAISRKGSGFSPAAGLRYAMDTFIIRLDAGFGNEAMGIYFNFGHLF